MIKNEKQLAKGILAGEARMELSEKLVSGVEKIKKPSDVVWKSVAAALATSAFFWAGGSSLLLGMMVGLPAVLAVSGGVGGIVFLTLGAVGTVCAFRLRMAGKTLDVLNQLRNNYQLEKNILTRV